MKYVESDKDMYDREREHATFFKVEIIALIVLIASLAISVPIMLKVCNLKSNLTKDRKETIVDRIINRLISDTTKVALPTRYIVPDKYILPPSDQASRGICWAFATIFLLESQYRANGIDKGFLKESEYVNFSKQAYAKYLLDKCEENPDVSPCKHGGLGLHPRQTDDHKIDSIYYFLRAFPDLAKAILPEDVCPYQEVPEGQDKCDGIDQALKTNPIEFKIKSIEAANNIPMAKRLLISKQRPLGLGTPIPDYLFYAPCDDSSYSKLDICTNESKRTKCPEGYKSEYCAKIMVDSRVRDGTFVYVDDFSRIVYAGGHAVNIVGYNDDWVYKSRLVSEQSMHELHGGFIIHNSWRAPGHSVEYLMGRRSEENEAVICPNHLNPMNWIPATEECIKNNLGNYEQCGHEYRFVRGKGLTKHTDLLRCVDKRYCDPSRYYVLAQSLTRNEVDAQPLFSGLDLVKLISWPNTTDPISVDDIKTEKVDYFPFWALKLMLEPVNVVENDPLQCGYWMYPYDTTTMVNRKTWSLIDTFHVTDIEFEFSDSSYLSNKASDKDYTLLKKSTHNFTKTEFDGPLPYNYVY
ncbi:hypothetical protein M9Y10_041952 [Tritrichomonas musculus]|uniref:Peptidase C1A papain C-terminal domain-containing protein n=1 Tax=Tritrichomonas musculus TaxID=1915356 RepID=A0ABR2K5Z9_9EUKA